MTIQESTVAEVDEALKLANENAFHRMHPTGHWVAEVFADVTFTAEYIYVRHINGTGFASDGPALKHHILSEQRSDGSWARATNYPADTSTSTQAYLALKILGVPDDDPALVRAREFIRGSGGIATTRMFTKFCLAIFGLFPWDSIPQLPAEIMLMPKISPINIYTFAYWARCTCIPLLVIRHHQPKLALPGNLSTDCLDGLWVDPANKKIPYCPSLSSAWRTMDWVSSAFITFDKVLSFCGGLRWSPSRRYCVDQCMSWIIQRQDPDGTWGGLWPMLFGSMVALHLEGYRASHPIVAAGLRGMEGYAVEDSNSNGKRVQCCTSAVWDTILMIIGLRDAEVEDPRIEQAVQWLLGEQILTAPGDWQVYNPKLPHGGWAFGYTSDRYPDTDDTAGAVVALIKANSKLDTSIAITRGIVWVLGMQNSDGGWSTYERDNNQAFLNKIPLADAKNMIDPSTPCVTGHIIECLAIWSASTKKSSVDADLRVRAAAACKRALKYLALTQEESGPWWGRWGVNYIYGTSNVLCGLEYFKDEVGVPEMVDRAVTWFKSVQNQDGGWGDGLDTYSSAARAGRGTSGPTQTAWGVMGLLPHLSPADPSIRAGVSWLVQNQTREAKVGKTWSDDIYTAVGFPNYLWLNYRLYAHVFPLTALARYKAALASG